MIEYDDDGFMVMEDVPDTDLAEDELGGVSYDDPPPLGDAAWLRMVSTAVGHEQDPVAADEDVVADAGATDADDLPADPADLDWSIDAGEADGSDDAWTAPGAGTDDPDDDTV